MTIVQNAETDWLFVCDLCGWYKAYKTYEKAYNGRSAHDKFRCE